MEAGRRELVVLLLAAACLVPMLPGATPAEGTASGELTVNGTRVVLRHAYASAQPGFFDKTAEDIRILLSDVPLSDDARHDVFELMHLARGGKARIVEVVLDSSQQPTSGAIFDPAFDGMVSVAGMHRFEPTTVGHERIAGRLFMNGPSEFRGVTFEYGATFAAPIPRPPTAEETARALESPPAKAAQAYLDAIRSGDLPRFLSTLAPVSTREYSGPTGLERYAQLRADTPTNSHVVSLAMTDTGGAVATANGLRDGVVIEFVIRLVEARGTWKVAP